MNEKENRISELYQKYLHNACTPDELAELYTYIQDNNDHILLNIIEHTFESSPKTIFPNNKVVKISNNVRHNVIQKIRKGERYKVLRIGRLASVVAISLLVLGLSLMLYNFSKDQSVQLTSEFGDDILPGGNHAYITFSNGEHILLDTTESIVNLQNGVLTYSNGKKIKFSKSDYAKVTTPKGGTYQLRLPDGSRVWLNAQSMIKFPIFFSAERRVEMAGEVYFEVEKSHRSFVVKTNNQDVHVLGTAFNVKEYRGVSITTLAHGSINLISSQKKESVVLKPGEQTILSNNSFVKKRVIAKDYTTWIDGILLQKNASLLEMCEELERWYDVKFIFSKDYKNVDRAFHSINRKEMLSSILTALSHTYNVKFKIKGREVFVQ